MIEQPISGEAAVDRAEARRFLRFTACAADARRGIDDQAVLFDQARIHQRLECEDRRSGIAAPRGNRLRALDGVAMEFWNPVRERAEKLWRFMRVSVPAFVSGGVVQPEIGAEIDERDVQHRASR